MLVNPNGYSGDIFIFKASTFHELINSTIETNTNTGIQFKMYIAHCKNDNNWYMWKKYKFAELNSETVINVTDYRRNFSFL